MAGMSRKMRRLTSLASSSCGSPPMKTAHAHRRTFEPSPRTRTTTANACLQTTHQGFVTPDAHFLVRAALSYGRTWIDRERQPGFPEVVDSVVRPFPCLQSLIRISCARLKLAHGALTFQQIDAPQGAYQSPQLLLRPQPPPSGAAPSPRRPAALHRSCSAKSQALVTRAGRSRTGGLVAESKVEVPSAMS